MTHSFLFESRVFQARPVSLAFARLCRASLAPIPEALGIDHRRFTFVDIGSGRGRAVLIASRFPFRKIIGVELYEELLRVARSNLQTFRNATQRCRGIALVRMDAAEYLLPEGDVLLYLFNPFSRATLERVLENIRRARVFGPREVLILYSNGVHRALFDDAPLLGKVWDSEARPGVHAFAIYRLNPATGAECSHAPD